MDALLLFETCWVLPILVLKLHPFHWALGTPFLPRTLPHFPSLLLLLSPLLLPVTSSHQSPHNQVSCALDRSGGVSCALDRSGGVSCALDQVVDCALDRSGGELCPRSDGGLCPRSGGGLCPRSGGGLCSRSGGELCPRSGGELCSRSGGERSGDGCTVCYNCDIILYN